MAAFAMVSRSAMAAPNVTMTTVEELGLVAEIHSPVAAGLHPGILVLGGSEGGLEWAHAAADELAMHGYVAMALAYFRAGGLPGELQNIPLEYFRRSVDRLATAPGVDPTRLGIVGISKGAEAALLIASGDPRLKAVVAAAPSDVTWQGLDETGAKVTASWSQDGCPLAYMPFASCDDCAIWADLYSRSRTVDAGAAKARIPVERIKGPVLLISGGTDKVWPSAPMSDAIEASLHKAAFPYYVKRLNYADAGHFVFGPPLDDEDAIEEDAEFGGGTVESVARARADSWPRALAFLAGALRP